MKLQLISIEHVNEAVKYLVSGKDGDHLPYTGDDGKPNHRLMGAAWAALHGGYRGNKYEGPNKTAAISKLKALYKSEGMDTPEESAVSDIAGGVFFQESLMQSDSYSSIECKVMAAIRANIKAGVDMDGDDDGAEDSGRCTNCNCNCGQQYGCSCCGDCECTYPKSAWCRDLFPDAVVYSMDGKLMSCDYTIDADGDVQLDTPEEVEMSYTPVAERQSSDANESFRTLATECVSLKESAYDPSKGELTVTVIKPGMSKNRRNYSPAVLKHAAASGVFKGAKMFADHQTESEASARPEGSVHNWVATLGQPWAEGDGTVKSKATVIDPQFKAKLDRLNEVGQLDQMGVSIRAVGEASKKKDGEGEYIEVESILAARSVDFVTHAGAGGRVEAMESHTDEWDVDLISEADFRKRRPDLVKLIESSAQGAKEKMKSLEQQLQEANAQLAAKSKELTEANTKLAESEKTAKKAAASAELTKLLTESKLPEAAQTRVKKQFAEALSTDGMKEAIELEKEYIKSLTSGAGVRHMGASSNGTQESDKTGSEDAAKLLVESYQAAGLSEKESKLAAGVA